jgi:hypothetical protein
MCCSDRRPQPFTWGWLWDNTSGTYRCKASLGGEPYVFLRWCIMQIELVYASCCPGTMFIAWYCHC